MDAPSPLDPLDPNIPSRHSIGKSQDIQKPLPFPPSQVDRDRSKAPQTAQAATATSSPSHAGRPSFSTTQSYQRPRKRVLWRNKACMIALPLESESGKTNRENYLTPDEVAERLSRWQSLGFNTKGFVLDSLSAATASDTAQGQSRAIHPNPKDENEERSSQVYRVNIPDRREWETYVNQLKEKKLRALGVSSSGDDEVSSRKSPAPSLMSRQASSQSSAVLMSPPLPPMSAHAITFPPPLQHGNPNINPAVSHFPRYSMAVPFGEKPFSPPNQFQLSRSPVHGSWSPQVHLPSQSGGSRIASPAIGSQSFSLDGRLSPAPPPINPNIHHISTQQDSNDPMGRMRQQQSMLQAQHWNQQQKVLQLHPQHNELVSQVYNVKAQPAIGGARPDIATPIPQHRQNHSESLQREVDEAEAYDELSKTQDEETRGLSSSPIIQDIAKAIASKKGAGNLTDDTLKPDARVKPVNTSDEQVEYANGSPTRHESKASGSKFNVNAPVFKFEPHKAITPDIFSFLGNQKPEKVAQTTPASSTIRPHQSRRTSNEPSQATKFNVAAPVFTPGAALRPLVPSREFSFSSIVPSFRPDAPTFTPNDTTNIADSNKSEKENPVEAVKKIFGDINLSETVKSAKDSSAIPIIKPGQSPKNVNLEMEGQEDESGRITQADGRQKRMRHNHDNGDSVPLFASQSGESLMNRGEDERAAYFSRTQSPVSEGGQPSTLEAATDLLVGLLDEMPASEASSLLREESPDRASGRRFEEYTYHDIDRLSESDNKSIDPVRAGHDGSFDPAPEDVARATQDFLRKSSQYHSEFNRALDRADPRSPSHSAHSDSDRRPPKDDRIDCIDHAEPIRQDVLDGVRYVEPHEPSYHEIDAVMKQLNKEGDSDFGIERSPSPWRRTTSNAGHSPRPGRLGSAIANVLAPPTNIRSDAPSPSPNRLREAFQYLPPTDMESADSAAVEMIARNARYSPSYRPSRTSPSVHRLNSPGSTPRSDWDDAISSLEDEKLKLRTGFFDSRVNDLVGGIVQQRLGPLERTLFDIKQSISHMPNRQVSRTPSRRPRSSGTLEIEHSDADDEDDTVQHSQARLKSPLRDRKYDQLKSSLNEVAAAQHNSAQASQLIEVMTALKDLKSSVQQTLPTNASSTDIKTVIEEVVGKQMRGRSAPVTSTSQAAAVEKSQLHIAGLESMLKIAETRAEDELQARRATEDALADNQRLLRAALQDAAEQRESAEETERSLHEYHAERQHSLKHAAILEGAHQILEKTASDLSDKNAALESTLAEYRLSHDQWRTDIDNERHENKDLRRSLASLKTEMEGSLHERRNLRVKFDELQEKAILASREVTSDRLRWCSKEEEHINRLEMLGARLEAEARTRERLELEIERLESQEKESMKARISVEQSQKANAHLDKLVGQLQTEVHEHQNAADRAQRDLHAVKETNIMENHRMQSAMEADVEAAKSHVGAVRTGFERVIKRLETQLTDADKDADKARSRHSQMLEEASESRHAALREAADARENALQEHYRFHERTLQEAKLQYERKLENTVEDKQRSETFFGHRLSLADEKIIHLQDKVDHLGEKLEIAKSAAHAAVQAAQGKRSAEKSSHPASVPARAFEIPEKISPQALRESILVLQEQLQDRESRIEQLESQLSVVDTDAPTKVKEADIEIAWLRELLGVRIDDLQDIITTLSQPWYDREAVKDAAIRLKANLQMEQQEKERALAGGQAFPSLSSLSGLASSPRALPLAAAAAWGNWRKGRDAGFGKLDAIANRSNSQTPSKPSSSPQSFFAGLMTPPSTDMRTAAETTTGSKLNSSSNRAVRGPSTPKQKDGRQNQGLATKRQPEPVTPPLMRKANYDFDANENSDVLQDMGQSGYAREEYEVGEEEEPFGPRIGTYST